MIRALVQKELRELRPYLVLGLVLLGVDVADALLGFADMKSLAAEFKDSVNGIPLVLFLLAFAVGTGISTREREERTLGFIDGLPLGRTPLFLAKLLTALPVLLLFPALRLLFMSLLHLLSRGDLDRALHPNLLAMALATTAVVVLAGLTLGAAFGLLGSLAWGGAAAAAAGLALLMMRIPRAAILNPLALTEPELRGSSWPLDGEALLVQLGIAAVCALVAWRGFLRAGLPPRTVRRPLVGAAVATFTVAAVLGAVAAWSSLDEDAPSSGKPRGTGPQFPTSPPAELRTLRYRFSYPALRATEALVLAQQSDAVFDWVRRLLDAEVGEPIEVDLSGSTRNTAGTAFLGRIRMKPGADALPVLAHETAHVLSRRMAGEERAHLWKEVPVLNEGLASWVEHHVRADPEPHLARLVLAALHQRGQLRLSEVIDFDAFARALDDGLKYPVGEALVESMVRSYGREAPRRLVRAFATETLPPDLRGPALWQASFQLAGMDLGRVFDGLLSQAAEDARSFAAELQELPRPRPLLVKSNGRFGARALLDRPLPDGWSLVLRFRPAPDSPVSRYDTEWVEPDEVAWRDPGNIRKRRVCVQAGIARGDHKLYEEWTCIPEEDAVEWQEERAEELE